MQTTVYFWEFTGNRDDHHEPQIFGTSDVYKSKKLAEDYLKCEKKHFIKECEDCLFDNNIECILVARTLVRD